MKLIDRHIVRAFLVPFLFCLLAFSMVLVVVDLFDKMDTFLDARTPALLVARYYLILLPSLLYWIVPVSVLLAVMYALYQLSKNNELTALRASGVSLHRMVAPLLIIGLLISTLILLVNESFGPTAKYWCNKFITEQNHDDLRAHIFRDLAFKKERGQRVWYVGTFDTRDYTMNRIEITQLGPRGSGEVARITADGGAWLDNTWVLTNVTTQAYDPDGSPRGATEFKAHVMMTDLTEIPDDFLQEIKDPNFLSSSEISDYIRAHRRLDLKQIAVLRTEYHSRLAWPWASFIVIMLGIPVGTHTGRKGVMPAIALSLLLLLGYLTVFFLGLYLGNNRIFAPLFGENFSTFLGGWLPVLTYLPIATSLLARLR